MGYVTEAYPIIVFCKQLENKQRRLMENMECEILPDNSRNYRTLFRYEITENRYENNQFLLPETMCGSIQYLIAYANGCWRTVCHRSVSIF
jgi:hypothetical protein